MVATAGCDEAHGSDSRDATAPAPAAPCDAADDLSLAGQGHGARSNGVPEPSGPDAAGPVNGESSNAADDKVAQKPPSPPQPVAAPKAPGDGGSGRRPRPRGGAASSKAAGTAAVATAGASTNGAEKKTGEVVQPPFSTSTGTEKKTGEVVPPPKRVTKSHRARKAEAAARGENGTPASAPAHIGPFGGPPPSGRVRGWIKSFNEDKGFGFIESPECYSSFGCDVFFHVSQLNDNEVGPDIMFRVVPNRHGRPQARDITALNTTEYLHSVNSRVGIEAYLQAIGAGPPEAMFKPGSNGKAYGKGAAADQYGDRGPFPPSGTYVPPPPYAYGGAKPIANREARWQQWDRDDSWRDDSWGWQSSGPFFSKGSGGQTRPQGGSTWPPTPPPAAVPPPSAAAASRSHGWGSRAAGDDGGDGARRRGS
eukprot:gnl/TRDRNA2_/TRDRNA2_83881_c0_seq1.p1 gnl/TRDRNA2_/TRDRNA2_83881_c0~~gnl/TRDRNA2_/TRDRNA2_83881_c0_seq1.p1  ORF type:complete len:423 (-),score=68.44 gnl/TRDRNA2_/TRDRNA2_83881_c0_seq1:366-1634(-)